MKRPQPHEGMSAHGRLEFPWMPAVVYYCLDRRDVPLYIGVSTNLALRLGQHAATKPWWHEVVRVEWIDFHTIEEAKAYEAAQIRELDPVGNVAGRELRGGTYIPAALP